MEREIKLKELAAYAPYKLGVIIGDAQRDLTAISVDSPYCFVTRWKGSREKEMVNISSIKPILRPLSDLNKPINHISYTKELIGGSKELVIPSEIFRDNWFLTIRNDGHFSINHGDGTCTGFLYQSASYSIISLLLEWHFDVFGLIDAGLAIDINTI